jgi:hypothetical protein
MLISILPRSLLSRKRPDGATIQHDGTSLKRGALMPTNPQRTTRPYPPSVGNVALADESLGVYHTPNAKDRSPQLRLVQDWMAEESE